LDDYCIELNTDVTTDRRRYNAPTASQVAAIWMEGNDPQRRFDRSVLVYARGDRPRYIKAYHGCYDPSSYLVYHPRGETRWNKYIPYTYAVSVPTLETPTTPADGQPMFDTTDDHHGVYKFLCFIMILMVYKCIYFFLAFADDIHAAENQIDGGDDDIHEDFINRVDEATHQPRYVTIREWCAFKLQIRRAIFNVLLFGGRLFQQWTIDMYIKMESMRLDWYSNPKHQKIIRAELYQVRETYSVFWITVTQCNIDSQDFV